VREPDDRKIAGLCAGIADHLGVDVSIVRLIAVMLAVFTPVGLIGYLVGWAVVPQRRADQPRVVAPRAELPDLRRVPQWVVLVAVVAGLIAISDDSWWWPEAPAGALVLLGFGLWLLLRDGDDGPSATAPPPGAQPPGAVADGWTHPMASSPWEDGPETDLNTVGGRGTTLTPDSDDTATSSGGAGPLGEPPPPVPAWWSGSPTPSGDAADRTWAGAGEAGPVAPPPAQRSRRPRSHVTLVVVALLLVGGGLLWLLDTLGLADVSAPDSLAAGLVVIGAGLVFAAWRGRAWALVPLGLVLVATVVALEVVDVPIDAGMGDREVVVDTRAELADLADGEELFAGKLTLDLSDAPLPANRVTRVEAAVGMGHLVVIVPPDADIEVDARVKAGNVAGHLMPDPDEGGVDIHEMFSDSGREGGADLVLDLRTGLGQVEVRRG
jgi:phage shock protein PspC (stress-responsive transcriptional regulator)